MAARKRLIMRNVIWITGASSGIGAELARQYAQEKDRALILSARRVKKLEEVKKSCNPQTPIALLPFDLKDFDNAATYVEQALSFFGKIDLLINNGGVSQRSKILGTNFSVFKTLIEVDYLGSVALSHALLPYFVAQQKGHFAVVSSVMGKYASPYRAGYCGAKHALHGFFDALRMEHEKDNINVTMICPGFVQTNVTINALTESGAPLGTNDPGTENGLNCTSFCKNMRQAIAQKKTETYYGKKEKWGVYIKRLSNRMLHRIVMKSAVR